MRPAPADKLRGPRVRLSGMFTPLRPARSGTSPDTRRRAARNRIAAGAKQDGAGRYSVAPSALPRDPTQKAVLLVLLTLSRLGAPRTASLSSAAAASVGRRSSPFVAVVARPRPVGPHPARPFALGPRSAPLRRHPRRAGGRRRCAPPPALGRALRPAPSRLPPCAGPGSCPGPCRFPGRLRRPRRVAPPAALPCCRC